MKKKKKKKNVSYMARLTSIALLTDPNLVLLLRLSRIYFARCDVLDFLREEIKSFVEKVYSQLVHSGSGAVIEKDEVISACHSIGYKFLGAGCLSQMQKESNTDIVKAFISAQQKNPLLKGFSYWNALKKAFCSDMWSDTARLRMSFICMRSLIESGRAFVPVPVSGPGGDLSVVAAVCVRLDKNTFRLVLSFLGDDGKKRDRTRVLFGAREVTDNFSSELCHGSIAEALAAGVQDIQSVLDPQTDTSFLHVQAARGRTEDVQALLSMGVDPRYTPSQPATHPPVNDDDIHTYIHTTYLWCSIANGSMWENGDGWGELEFLRFTPLHFAAANGRFDAAKALLEHGAKAQLQAGWDGGAVIPLTKPGSDYWYTGGSTPLHQAARGNHAAIVHLLLGGPSAAAVEAAAQRGVDLRASWGGLQVDATGPSEDFESADGSQSEALPLTALAVALMFGSLAAARALLQHGASFDKIGRPGGVARQCILDGLMARSLAKCRPYVLQRLRAAEDDQDQDEDVASFMRKYGDPSVGGQQHQQQEEEGNNKGKNKEEEEDAWLRDDWDDLAVGPGDALVPEDEETGLRIVVVEPAGFAAAIAALQLQVHPCHCLSRNAQLLCDDMARALLADLLRILQAQQLRLSPESVQAAITAYLREGQLLQCGLAEAAKEGGGGDGEAPLFLQQVIDIVQQQQQQGLLPEMDEPVEEAAADDRAVGMLARFVEYLLAEVLETSGNCSREKHLQVIWPAHIHAAVQADEELQRAFKDFVLLDCIQQSRLGGEEQEQELEWHLGAYEKGDGTGFVKADEFEQQQASLLPSALPSVLSSPLSALQLARMEVEYFTGQVRTGPVMARSYFQQFCGSGSGPGPGAAAGPLSEEAALVLQLVAEQHLRRLLGRGRDRAARRIAAAIQTHKALRPYLPDALADQDQGQAGDEEGDGEGKEGQEGEGDASAAVADLFSCRLDLCYADLKSVLE